MYKLIILSIYKILILNDPHYKYKNKIKDLLKNIYNNEHNDEHNDELFINKAIYPVQCVSLNSLLKIEVKDFIDISKKVPNAQIIVYIVDDSGGYTTELSSIKFNDGEMEYIPRFSTYVYNKLASKLLKPKPKYCQDYYLESKTLIYLQRYQSRFELTVKIPHYNVNVNINFIITILLCMQYGTIWTNIPNELLFLILSMVSP